MTVACHVVPTAITEQTLPHVLVIKTTNLDWHISGTFTRKRIGTKIAFVCLILDNIDFLQLLFLFNTATQCDKES